MKRYLLSILVLAGISMQANAQFGLSSSYQLSHHKSEITGRNAVMNGFRGGLFYDFWLNHFLVFEPGVMYSYGSNIRTGYNSAGVPVVRNAADAVTEHYLHIPMQAKVVLPVGAVTSVSLYFGPTIALALSVPEGYSRSGMMLGGGAGLDLGPVSLKAGYDLGAGYRGALCIGLTYSFGDGFGYGYAPRGGRSARTPGRRYTPRHPEPVYVPGGAMPGRRI